MPSEEDLKREREMGSAGSSYSLFGAEQDPAANAIAKILSQKFGGAEGLIRDLTLAIQALAGLDNKGVTMAQGIRGAVQNYGLPGQSSTGQSMFMGGRDVASFYTAQAVQREVLKEFVSPVTGLPNSKAYGLNAGEMGQAAQIAFSSGQQFAGRASMFETQKLTAEVYKDLQTRAQKEFDGGDSSLKNELATLKEGDTRQILSEDGKNRLKKMMDDANATLGAIKDVMGSESLKNLDQTMSTLFGGKISEFGLQASRLRMTQIKAMGSATFGGGAEGNKDAAAAYAASADSVLSGIAPGMHPDEARAKFGLLGAHAATYATRQAAAGGAAAAANVGVAAGVGIQVKAQNMTEIANEKGKQAGQYMSEESAQAAMEYSLQLTRNGGTEEQKAEAERLRQQMIDAGADKDKIAAARQGMEAFVGRMTGMSTGDVVARAGGHDKLLSKLTEDAVGNLSRTATGSIEARNQGLMEDAFRTDSKYQTEEYGLTQDEAALLGKGAMNLSDVTNSGLEAVMDDMQSPEQNYANAKEYFDKNPGARSALRSAGVDEEEYLRTLSEKGSKGLTTALKQSGRHYAGQESFIGKEDQQKQVMDELAAFNRDHQGGANSTRGDFMEEFLKGLTGVREWKDDELLGSVAADKATADQVKTFGMKDNLLTGEGDEAAGLAAALKGKVPGMPTDPDELRTWLKDPANNQAAQSALATDGVLSMKDGKARWMGKDSKEAAQKNLDTAAMKAEHKLLTGDDLDIETVKNDKGEVDPEKIKERLNESINKDDLGQLIKAAAYDSFGNVEYEAGKEKGKGYKIGAKGKAADKWKAFEKMAGSLDQENRTDAIEVARAQLAEAEGRYGNADRLRKTAEEKGDVEGYNKADAEVRKLSGTKQALREGIALLEGSTAQTTQHMTVAHLRVEQFTAPGQPHQA